MKMLTEPLLAPGWQIHTGSREEVLALARAHGLWPARIWSEGWIDFNDGWSFACTAAALLEPGQKCWPGWRLVLAVTEVASEE